jgi:hypothetical protein
MSDNRTLYIEEKIIKAVKKLLVGQANEILSKAETVIPTIEFGGFEHGYAVAPVIVLNTCEKTEKERIIRLDAYTLTITFSLMDTPESELHCYTYSGAVSKALYDNPTLGGVVDRAVITGKKYTAPKNPHCGEGWGLSVSLRVVVEGIQ